MFRDDDRDDRTYMLQSMFRTNMAQSMYSDRNRPLTRMAQGMFNIGSNLVDEDEYNESSNRNDKVITKMRQSMFRNKTEK